MFYWDALKLLFRKKIILSHHIVQYEQTKKEKELKAKPLFPYSSVTRKSFICCAYQWETILSNKPSSGSISLVDINNGKEINSGLCSFLLNTHLRAKMPKQPENTLCLLGGVFKHSVPCLAIHEQSMLQCLASCRTCSKGLKYNDQK